MDIGWLIVAMLVLTGVAWLAGGRFTAGAITRAIAAQPAPIIHAEAHASAGGGGGSGAAIPLVGLFMAGLLTWALVSSFTGQKVAEADNVQNASRETNAAYNMTRVAGRKVEYPTLAETRAAHTATAMPTVILATAVPAVIPATIAPTLAATRSATRAAPTATTVETSVPVTQPERMPVSDPLLMPVMVLIGLIAVAAGANVALLALARKQRGRVRPAAAESQPTHRTPPAHGRSGIDEDLVRQRRERQLERIIPSVVNDLDE